LRSTGVPHHIPTPEDDIPPCLGGDIAEMVYHQPDWSEIIPDAYSEYSLNNSQIASSNQNSDYEDQSDTDSIDYDYMHPFLPKLKPFSNKNTCKKILNIYNPALRLRCCIRCRHSSRNSTIMTIASGPNFYCLCHGHGKGGIGHNMNIALGPGHMLVDLTCTVPFMESKIIYTGTIQNGKVLTDVPSLLTLTQATMFANNLFHYFYTKDLVPNNIKKRVPKLHKRCFKLECKAENTYKCQKDCPTKLKCDYYMD